ncbi:MAG: hypothetical protein ACYTG0_14680 [Planctomycetota bacterium]|jgi:hypothetical protein
MPEKKFRLSAARPAIRLRGTSQPTSSVAPALALADVIETVVQRSLKVCARRRAEGVRVLESCVIVKSIAEVLPGLDGVGNQIPPEITPLSRLVGLFEFRLQNRRYGSVRQEIPRRAATERAPDEIPNGNVFRRLRDAVASETTELGEVPKRAELMKILFEHLSEVSPNGPSASPDTHFQQMHSARRSALLNWQRRVEKRARACFDHADESATLYGYPIVDVLFLDNTHLALFLVSPLDENFVDEKVPQDHRVSEIALALYQIPEQLHPNAEQTLLPLLRQAFARVLFTSMAEKNS